MKSLFRWYARWYKKDSAKGFITTSVVLTHFILLCLVIFQPSLFKKKALKQKLVVKTFQAPPSKTVKEIKKNTQTTASKPSKPAASKPKPAKSATSSQNSKKTQETKKEAAQTIKPSQPQKKPASTKKTTKVEPVKKSSPKPSSKEEPMIPEDLLSELEQKLSKWEDKKEPSNRKSSLPVPKAIEPVHEETETTSSSFDTQLSDDYADYLVDYLHRHLHLPEFGEVKIQITLKKDGTVEKLVVLKTESEKNRKYLEEALPKLHFPDFQGMFAGKQKQTFVLTFCNEL